MVSGRLRLIVDTLDLKTDKDGKIKELEYFLQLGKMWDKILLVEMYFGKIGDKGFQKTDKVAYDRLKDVMGTIMGEKGNIIDLCNRELIRLSPRELSVDAADLLVRGYLGY